MRNAAGTGKKLSDFTPHPATVLRHAQLVAYSPPVGDVVRTFARHPWLSGQGARNGVDREARTVTATPTVTVTTESWTAMQDETPRTDHPAEGVDLPLPGIQTASDMQDAEQNLMDTSIDLESNELHAAGRMCARCGRTMDPDEDVRRTASGAYQHEICPR
jgi:hypothetical protein